MTTPLHDVLLRPIVDTPRTRLYQAAIDAWVDQLPAIWDQPRGLINSRGVELPHESNSGYWEMDFEQRAKVTSPQAQKVYEANNGRASTASLITALFAWYSPLSRHRGRTDLLEFFQKGLRFHVSAIRKDGLPLCTSRFALETWCHGWDVEGLIYGMILAGDKLDPELRHKATEAFQRSATWYAGLSGAVLGSYGNQRSVHALGLYLYGQFLNRPDLLAAGDLNWRDVMPRVMNYDGQVIEQQGPCMHYSYTAFIYAWLNIFLRDPSTHLDQLEEALLWFRNRHTQNGYPIAGPTVRRYDPKLNYCIADLYPAAEHLSEKNPLMRQWIDQVRLEAQRSDGRTGDHLLPNVTGHGGSPLMWAILARPSTREADETDRQRWVAPFSRCYMSTNLLKRFPLKYVLIRRQYQTHYNFRDFMPFSGIQTWAWENEAPLVHPTPLYPSTTVAWGLDTARQGTSHNWGLYGAGSLGVDGYPKEANNPEGIYALIARYDRHFRVVIFTPVSTVQVEWGRHGPRKTFWTLNPIQPVPIRVRQGMIEFTGRIGRLYSSVNAPPVLHQPDGRHEWSKQVIQLEYDCGNGPAGFALSNDSFRFLDQLAMKDRAFEFADDSGRYRVTAPQEMFLDADVDPGCFSVDVWQLVRLLSIQKL